MNYHPQGNNVLQIGWLVGCPIGQILCHTNAHTYILVIHILLNNSSVTLTSPVQVTHYTQQYTLNQVSAINDV